MKPYHRLRRSLQFIAAIVLLLIVVDSSIFAQVTIFPLDYQLYPRDLLTNKATIHVAGTVALSTGYTQVRLKRYRNNSLQKTTNISLAYNVNGVAAYDITNDITAELANYKFNLYGYKSGVETLIKSVNNVVAGDAYIIQGQSNAVANLRGVFTTANNADDPSNSPNRNYVRVYGNGSATSSYTHGWFIGRGNAYYDTDGQTGQWGMRLASNLAGAKKVPIALFNGASPGQPIHYFFRNDANHGDPSTNYGRLLNRITEAGFKNNIRGVIWHQGESDILGTLSSTQLTTDQYKSSFKGLLNDWKEDFPGLAKFLILQIRFGCGMSNADNCLKIQEAQRQLDKESTEIVTIGTGNTSQLFDGGTINYCHYNLYDGYKNMGDWASKIIRREVYNETSLPANIESPEPESAEFSIINAQGLASQVTLKLKDQASTFTISGDLTSLFRLDGGSYTVTAVTLSGNNVLIDFTSNSGTTTNPTTISYRGHDQVAAPQIINSGGLALIYFDKFTITQNVPPPPPPPACTDAFEPNNTIATSKSINANTTYTATIGSATDEDWYRFRTWAPWRYVKVSIWGMAADYDLYLYDVNGVLLSSSTISGNSAEAVIYNLGPDDFNYRLKVVSKDGGFNTDVCYSIRLQASSAAWPANSPPYATSAKNNQIVAPMEEVARIAKPEIGKEISTYPNPVRQSMQINYPADKAGAVELRVYDLTGRQIMTKRVTAGTGKNQFQLNVSSLMPGTYLLQMRKDNSMITRKFQVGSK